MQKVIKITHILNNMLKSKVFNNVFFLIRTLKSKKLTLIDYFYEVCNTFFRYSIITRTNVPVFSF